MRAEFVNGVEELSRDPGVQGLLLLFVTGILVTALLDIAPEAAGIAAGIIAIVYFTLRFIRAVERIADGIEALADEQDGRQTQ